MNSRRSRCPALFTVALAALVLLALCLFACKPQP